MTICPYCKQSAPTIARGLRTYCIACGAPRSLLSDTPVNVAGKPAQVGGGVAHVIGWLAILGGTLTALTVGALLQWLSLGVLGYIVGGFILGVSLLIGVSLVLGGRKLKNTGAEQARSAHEEAVFSLAARSGGSVTAAELSRSLAIGVDEADALLTTMAKRPDGRVTLEVDDDGTLRYFVPEVAPARRIRADRIRIAEDAKATDPTDGDAASEAEQDLEPSPARRRGGR